MLSQDNTDLLKKLTFRTAHKFGNIGLKVSGVALSGQDWTHINEDEYEGHDPAFIGRPNLKEIDLIAEEDWLQRMIIILYLLKI